MINNPLQSNSNGLGRRTSQSPERVDFSKIYTSAQIPNLIEVQRESYNRFLQMDLIPEEREYIGLQSVFASIFPISDFRETATLEYRRVSDRQLAVQVRKSRRPEHLRANCKNCGSKIKVDPFNPAEVLCNNCGTFNAVRPKLCDNCGEPVGLKHKHDQQECQERGMSYSVPLKVKIRLTVYDKDPETERLDDPRHQGRRRFLRRDPADDRQRHVHHQRNRARHRLAASPLARRVL